MARSVLWRTRPEFIAAIGAVVEVLQKGVPGRAFEYTDLAANAAGVLMGAWLGRGMRQLGQRKVEAGD